VRRFQDEYVRSQIKSAHALGPVPGVSKTFIIETGDQRERLKQFIDRRPLPFQAELGEVRVQRSTSQNSRLWALHALASKETGYTPDEMHELMLCKFFGTKQISVGDEILTVPMKRSSTREKKEFHEFLESVETFYASELGVWLGQDE
jgi:hypothetical protein